MAALLVVPALDLSGAMPLTPGNVGLTSNFWRWRSRSSPSRRWGGA